jgi:glycosyltransferase involved in cell wall biosynthesis
MNIGFFTDTYVPQINGVVTSISILTQALERLGHRVYIVAPAIPGYRDPRPGIFRVPSIRFVFQPEHRVASPVSLSILRRTAGLGLDVLHAHTPFGLGILAFQVARARHLPLVQTYHTLFPEYVHYVLGGRVITPGMARRASAFACNRSDVVVAPSEKIKELLLSYGVKRPIRVIHNGLDLERFQGQPRGLLRSRLGLAGAEEILLTVGRLGKEKNLEFLIRAFGQVVRSRPTARLVIVGDGPERNRLVALATGLGLAQRVLFPGYLAPGEMPQVYADADLFVFASTTEVHPMVLLEALASGLPIVAVRDPAVASTVVPGENGFLIGQGDDGYAQAILKLLAEEPLRRAMGQASRELSRRFSSTIQAERLVGLYQEMTAATRTL